MTTAIIILGHLPLARPISINYATDCGLRVISLGASLSENHDFPIGDDWVGEGESHYPCWARRFETYTKRKEKIFDSAILSIMALLFLT